jgi:UDP-N-acetylmuramoyl-tripeptide--D-alanyl-D-alanine ligase
VTGTYSLGPLSSEVRVRTPAGDAAAPLAAPGVHNVRNAVAASACAFAAGIPPQAIARGLHDFRPYSGRSQVLTLAERRDADQRQLQREPGFGSRRDRRARGRRHRHVARARRHGRGRRAGSGLSPRGRALCRREGRAGLYALGEQTVHAVAGFGTGARHFATIEELIKAVRAASARDATLLVKGSRFMRMERVVAALAPAAGGGH